MMKTYRENGALGALLDEYENVLEQLFVCLDQVEENELTKVLYPEAKKDFVSIASILHHVIRAGYWYTMEVRMQQGEKPAMPAKEALQDVAAFKTALKKMFAANVELFEDHKNIVLEEYDNSKKMKARWGQSYDIEQLLEHAIVHILRHRRQIERYLIIIRKQ